MNNIIPGIPKSRNIVWRSDINHPKQHHKNIIQRHSMNKQLEVFYPNNDSKVKKSILKLKQLDMFYYVAKMKLSDLIQPSFIQNNIENNKFYAIALNAPIDRENTFAILPSGEIILSITNEDYQSLGLTGMDADKHLLKKFHGSHSYSNSQRYLVKINILSKKFRSGGSYYNRLVACLDRIPSFEMMMIRVKDDEPQTIRFPHSVEVKRIDINNFTKEFQDIYIPNQMLFQDNSSHSDEDNSSMNQKIYSDILEIHEWLGAMACRFEDLLKHSEPQVPFVSDYVCLKTIVDKYKQNGMSIRWSGMISDSSILSTFQEVQQQVNLQAVPWAAILVWGFQDSPVSWQSCTLGSNNSHGYLVEGTNSYVFILLPGDRYWCIQSLGPSDTTM